MDRGEQISLRNLCFGMIHVPHYNALNCDCKNYFRHDVYAHNVDVYTEGKNYITFKSLTLISVECSQNFHFDPLVLQIKKSEMFVHDCLCDLVLILPAMKFNKIAKIGRLKKIKNFPCVSIMLQRLAVKVYVHLNVIEANMLGFHTFQD